MKYGEGVTSCKKHQSTVYPDAGPKYLREYHEEHKNCAGPSYKELESQLTEARALMKRVVDNEARYGIEDYSTSDAIDDMAHAIQSGGGI